MAEEDFVKAEKVYEDFVMAWEEEEEKLTLSKKTMVRLIDVVNMPQYNKTSGKQYFLGKNLRHAQLRVTNLIGLYIFSSQDTGERKLLAKKLMECETLGGLEFTEYFINYAFQKEWDTIYLNVTKVVFKNDCMRFVGNATISGPDDIVAVIGFFNGYNVFLFTLD